jgi:hypothetical protein
MYILVSLLGVTSEYMGYVMASYLLPCCLNEMKAVFGKGPCESHSRMLFGGAAVNAV